MPIPFTCPHCGASSTVDDRFAGQSGPCGACGKPITVPYPVGAYGPPTKSSGGATGAGLIIGILAAVVVGGGCVIAILAALLLPAVGAARNAARRSQSQ